MRNDIVEIFGLCNSARIFRPSGLLQAGGICRETHFLLGSSWGACRSGSHSDSLLVFFEFSGKERDMKLRDVADFLKANPRIGFDRKNILKVARRIIKIKARNDGWMADRIFPNRSAVSRFMSFLCSRETEKLRKVG